jgi:hypothetical protein
MFRRELPKVTVVQAVIPCLVVVASVVRMVARQVAHPLLVLVAVVVVQELMHLTLLRLAEAEAVIAKN